VQYRSDIDGLRGIAVGAVVLFHAGVPGFSGGFVGVDIFFVISGFLITTLLLEQVRSGRLDLIDFYDRRIRRIIPALIAVYLFCVGVGALILMPDEFKDFGKSLTASSLFFANVHFYKMVGYFDTPSATKPLLHIWSLSIEEQFYIIWPIALLVLFRYLRRAQRLPVLMAAIAVSLAYAEWRIMAGNQAAAFYLLPARGWELLVGALLAMTITEARVGKRFAEAAAGVGLTLIVVAIVSLTPDGDFPGLEAVLPCAGAALLILAGHRQTPVVSRLYSNRVMVALGLVSYSLYLWHWPLFSYWQIAFGRRPSAIEAGILIAASLVAAVLSFRYIEQPFRRRREGMPAVRVIQVGSLVICLGAVFGVTANAKHGVPQRFGGAIGQLLSDASTQFPSKTCERPAPGDEATLNCAIGVSSAEKAEVLLVGDSHAGHYVALFDQILAASKRSGRVLTHEGCPPILDTALFMNGRERTQCRAFLAKVGQANVQPLDAKLVIIAARWDLYTEATRSEILGHSKPYWLGDAIDPLPQDAETSRRVLERSLRHMVSALVAQGKSVILMGQVPPFPTSPIACVGRARLFGRDDKTCFVAAPEIRQRLAFSNGLLRRLASASRNVYAFIPSDILCNDAICSPFLADVFLYHDDDHISAVGARQLVKYVVQLPPFAGSQGDSAAVAPNDLQDN
jgi:peptidoglycan/LPS O-acetylase OafA/YrhL